MSDPRYEAGLDVLSSISGSEAGGKFLADFYASRGALGSIVHRTGAGEIWARDQLSRRDRSLVVISALAAMGREVELRVHVGGGLNHGLTRDEIDEIMLQLCAYVGAPFALGGAAVADAVFAERDGTQARETPPSPLEVKAPEKRRADGLEFLKSLLGQPDLDTELTEQQILDAQGDLGNLVMDYAFGDVWVRPQLSRRDRSLVVISALAALNLKHELEIHIAGALNHGATRSEIEEVMITIVLYGGFPRAIDGMILARKVFAAFDAAE